MPGTALKETAVQAIFGVHGAAEIGSIAPLNVRVLQVAAAARDHVLDALQDSQNQQQQKGLSSFPESPFAVWGSI
ncbi:MAG: hypothetical protein ABIU29_08935 [Chthoniobacterales bacterium]